MKRYVTGMMTGAMVGAIAAGVWLLKRPRGHLYRRAFRQAERFGPAAYKVARYSGNRLWHLAKRRIR